MSTKTTKTNKTDTAAHFNVSLTTLDNWLRRGCPHTEENGTRMFDIGEIELWQIFQKMKNEKPYLREVCAKSASELIEKLDHAQSALSFWMNANHWTHPKKKEIGKRISLIDDAMIEIEELLKPGQS